MYKPVYHILLNIVICHECESIYSSPKLWEVHGVKTRLYAGAQAPPITWHSFSAELGGHVGLGIATQHAMPSISLPTELRTNWMPWNGWCSDIQHTVWTYMWTIAEILQIYVTQWSAEGCDTVTFAAAQGIVWIRYMLSCTNGTPVKIPEDFCMTVLVPSSVIILDQFSLVCVSYITFCNLKIR